MGLLRHDVPPWDEKNAGFHGVVGIDPTKLNLIYAELQPGDTVFFVRCSALPLLDFCSDMVGTRSTPS